MNKKLFITLNLIIIFFFTSCSKKELTTDITTTDCAKQTLVNTAHLISNDLLKQMDYRLDTIEASGEFQIRSYTSDSYGTYAKCNQFYKDLPLFFNDVNFIFTGGLTIMGDIVDTINIALEPQVTYTKASEIAHKKIDAKKCYDVTLGIFDLNATAGNVQPEFRLVWKITSGGNEYPYAIIDAQNEKIIRYDDGVRN